MTQAPTAPIRYTPAVEQPEPNEAEVTRELVDTLHGIIETTYKDYGHAVRSVHAKSHALLEGTFEVLGGLPPVLAQGLFAEPGTYQTVLRISTNAGDILPDSVSLPRGMAVKVIGVDGDRLPGSEGDATQDFVMAIGPAFLAPTPAKFLANLKMLAKTTDRVEGVKKVLSATLRAAESALEAVGGESAMLKSMGGQAQTHPAGESYFTQAPLRYGDYIAKLSVVPLSPNFKALAGETVDIGGDPDGLRGAMNEFFGAEGGQWEVRAQLCTDLDKMPVEDASVPWDEEESPYIPVARITVEPQSAWSETRAKVVDDSLAFSPWHGLAAHQPLGGVMRARKPAYEMSSGFRGQHNGCPMHEPKSLETLPA
ncbi:catalase family protein [Sphingomonas profundi]|uniref:catalase family protein n=1 Tax=Alterirhizorhabdus profundi TaxID=2681549 RepID=UPI0012E86E3D|nr:catalase family protein [Sphingomonas profundi]